MPSRLVTNRTMEPATDDFYATAWKFRTDFELCIGCLSILLNFLVAYMAVSSRERTIRAFSTVLLMNIGSDLLFTLINLLTMTVG